MAAHARRSITSWRVLSGLAVALVGGLVLPTLAAPPVSPSAPTPIGHGVRLTAAHPVLTFAGEMPGVTPFSVRNPDPTVCVRDCQYWSVQIALKQSFLVAIRAANPATSDEFNLYVYDPHGSQVASATGVGSDGQSAVVAPTATGTYTIAVTDTFASETNPGYRGEVRLMSRPTWAFPRCAGPQPCPILPDLVPLPPSDVHVTGLPPAASTPLGFPLPVSIPTPSSCYADETVRTGATRCLRFTSEVDNIGFGDLRLRLPWFAASSGTPTSAFVPAECEAQQIIRYTDGTTKTHDAGPCQFHPQHAHFHYQSYVEYALHAVTPKGATGGIVAKSLKQSFCLADDGYFGFGKPAPNGPRDYVGQPGCNIPSVPTPDAFITMGNTPGWGDIYTWDTPDQFIDITTVPPGTYDIVARTNPEKRLLTSGRQQPCGATRIRLTSSNATVVKAKVPCV